VLFSGGGQRKTHPLQFANGVALHVRQPLARLIHRVQNGGKHLRLVASARLVQQRINLQAGPPLKKADNFQRNNHNHRGHHRRCVKSRPARHAD